MSDTFKHVRSGADPMVGTPQHILDLLDRLHALSLEQESKFNLADLKDKSDEEKKQLVSDQFVALEKDKCHFMYSIVRAINARTIVEAGTSYGVSTIYLALAAAANESSVGSQGKKPTVIATEHEPGKAAQARQYWAECGDAVSRVIDLREGDLRETLKSDVQDVDLLLLDIWTPMVMPTLRLVQPKLRHGAVILADNTLTSKGYDDFIEYVRKPDSGFVNVTVPYSNGLEMLVYQPKN